jgi:hypothetical protein
LSCLALLGDDLIQDGNGSFFCDPS